MPHNPEKIRRVISTPSFSFKTGNEKLAAKSANHNNNVLTDNAKPLIRLGNISERTTQVTDPKLAEKPAI